MKYKVIYGFDALAEEFNLKPKKPVQKNWAKPKQEAFCKCPKCGNFMKWVEGTNVMFCENPVTEKKPDGETEVKPCNYTRFLDEKSISYGNYIFSGGNYIKEA